MNFQSLVNIIFRRLWIVLLVMAAALAVTWWIDARVTPVYRSNVRLLIYADKTQLEGRDLIYGYYSLDQASIVATFVEIANSRRIFIDTMTALNLHGALPERIQLQAVSLPNSTVLELSARGPDPALVQQVADAAGSRIVDFVLQYYDGYTIEILDPAFLPAAPIEPNLPRDLAVASVLGLVLGSGLATLDYFVPKGAASLRRRRIYDPSSAAFTRAYLEKRLEEMSEAELEEGCLAIVHLNGVKALRDKMSRSLYGRLQTYVVDRMIGELRGKDLLARWGESSFAVFIPGVSTTEASRQLEALQTSLEQPQRFPSGGQWIFLDPRIGIVKTEDGMRLATMVQRTEAALSHSAQNGSRPVVAAGELLESRK